MKIKTLILLSSIFSCTIMANPTDVASSSGTNQATQLPKKTNTPQWLIHPKFHILDSELRNGSQHFLARVYANQQGKITKVDIIKSTGSTRLDQKLVFAIKKAQFKPFMVNGKAQPIIAELPISLVGSRQPQPRTQCGVLLHSNIWNLQKLGQETPFQYLQEPYAIIISKHSSIKITSPLSLNFKMKKNVATLPIEVEISQSSGNKIIDQEVKKLITNLKVQSKRTWFPFFKMKASDQITLDVRDCQ